MKLRIGRCRVSVSFWFFALLALAGAYGGEVMLSGIISAAVHECGHIAAACVCTPNAVPVCFDILPFGMKMGVIPSGLDDRRELAVLSGGIAVNIMAAMLCVTIQRVTGSEMFMRHAAAELCVAAVSAAPVGALDGGKILYLLLSRRMGVQDAERASFAISLAALFLTSAAGFYILLRSKGNFSLLALSLWLLYKILREK